LAIAGMLTYSCVIAAAPVQLPEERSQGDVIYLSGGVGQDEANAVERAKPNYPLSLEFVQHAKHRDEFISDVKITMTDKEGNTVLDTTSDGPYLLAKAPDGKYTVTATDENGKTLVRHVVVSADRPEHLVLVWS
jgi:hypothetical protein